MTRYQHLWHVALSLTVWRMLIALVLRLVGKAVGRPLSFAQRAVSSAILTMLGEACELVRRRWRAARLARRHQLRGPCWPAAIKVLIVEDLRVVRAGPVSLRDDPLDVEAVVHVDSGGRY
nr:hypothetical protein OH837_38785 [Streptomyces canus]